MAVTIELPIGTGFYESSSLPLADQECDNMYPTGAQTIGAVSQQSNFFSPGISTFTTMGSGPGRGKLDLPLNGKHYTVSGGTLYSLDSLKNVVALGPISGTTRCDLSTNGVTIAIQVPGGDGYFYDDENGLAKIVDTTYSDFKLQPGGVTSVTSKDGIFVFTTNAEFFLSSVVTKNKGQDFDGLDFATAEIKPDDNVRAITVKNELYIVGTDTIELFQNTGATDFPFQRITNATIDKGLVARFAMVEFDNSFVFMGGGINESVGVWRGLAGAATKISTPAIDNLIQSHSLAVQQEAFAYTYTEEGQFIVGITIGEDTIEYNATSSAMQGRPVWNTRSSKGKRFRVNTVADAFGLTLVTDQFDGRIGLMDRDIVTEYGETISRKFSGTYLQDQQNTLFVSRLRLLCENGVGNSASEDPLVKLEFSDDGGHTFFSLGTKRLGKAGEFGHYQEWRSLGRIPRQRVFRVTCDEPVRFNVLKMNLEVTGGIA